MGSLQTGVALFIYTTSLTLHQCVQQSSASTHTFQFIVFAANLHVFYSIYVDLNRKEIPSFGLR